MAYSEAQNKATQKYIKNNYDSFMVRFPKGEKELFMAHAESKGTSLNNLINELLKEDMQKGRS